MTKYIEYKDHEFCKAMGCQAYDELKKECEINSCFFTAKQFHKWLTAHGYKIVKENKYENEN
jgi:ribosomal protein L37E